MLALKMTILAKASHLAHRPVGCRPAKDWSQMRIRLITALRYTGRPMTSGGLVPARIRYFLSIGYDDDDKASR